MESQVAWIMGVAGVLIAAAATGYVAWTASNISRIWRHIANQQAQLAANEVKLESVTRIEDKLDRLLVNSHKSQPPGTMRNGKPGL